MEDRYLFKAKRLDNGEWVEGALFNGESHCIIGQEIKFSPYAEHECKIVGYEVDRDTICKCTGLKGKNGKLIWENDVVKQFADCNELGNSLYFFYQIRWNNEYSAFEGYEIYTEETVLFPDLEDIEVIGNIFDNPELLEVG